MSCSKLFRFSERESLNLKAGLLKLLNVLEEYLEIFEIESPNLLGRYLKIFFCKNIDPLEGTFPNLFWEDLLQIREDLLLRESARLLGEDLFWRKFSRFLREYLKNLFKERISWYSGRDSPDLLENIPLKYTEADYLRKDVLESSKLLGRYLQIFFW